MRRTRIESLDLLRLFCVLIEFVFLNDCAFFKRYGIVVGGFRLSTSYGSWALRCFEGHLVFSQLIVLFQGVRVVRLAFLRGLSVSAIVGYLKIRFIRIFKQFAFLFRHDQIPSLVDYYKAWLLVTLRRSKHNRNSEISEDPV